VQTCRPGEDVFGLNPLQTPLPASSGEAAPISVRGLFPGYFAMVMATGAVSIATHLLGHDWIALCLLWVNAGFYMSLSALTLLRLIRHADAFAADMRDHARGPGFFTLIAGTCILGSQCLLVAGAEPVAFGLWILGAALWLLISYWFFVAVTVRWRKPSLESGINGAWLLASVASQALSVLTVLLPWPTELWPNFVFLGLSLHLIGSMLYLAIIPLIFYRLTFVRLRMASLTPPYWINMGAAAIATLAGATLLIAAAETPQMSVFIPFLGGFTVLFWASATWWIPLLIGLTVWRHVVAHFPLHYDPQFWAMVFPLAMYTTGSLRLFEALDLDFLRFIPEGFVWLAMLAWLSTTIGLAATLVRRIIRPVDQGQGRTDDRHLH